MPLQSPTLAIQEMERCVEQLGLQGVQIGSHCEGWNLDAPELFPFFEAAADLGAAILVHPWDMMGRETMPKYWLPWLVGMPAEQSRAACCLIFGGVLERLPSLKVCFAHGGGSFPYTIGRIEHGFRMRPDLVATDNARNPREYFGRIYFDSCVHDDARAALSASTSPASTRSCSARTIRSRSASRSPAAASPRSGSPPPTQARLYHGTALEWLGLPHERFAPTLD